MNKAGFAGGFFNPDNYLYYLLVVGSLLVTDLIPPIVAFILYATIPLYGLCILVSQVKAGNKPHKGISTVLFSMMIGWYTIALIATGDFLNKGFGLLITIFLFITASFMSGSEEKRFLEANSVIMIFALLFSGFSLIDGLVFLSSDLSLGHGISYDGRLFGFAPHANTLGIIATFGMIASCIYIYKGTCKHIKIISIVEFLISLCALVLSNSRTAMLYFCVFFMLFLIAIYSSTRIGIGNRRRFLVFLLSLFALAIIGGVILICIIGIEPLESYIVGNLIRPESLKTATGRSEISRLTFLIAKDSPLFGRYDGYLADTYDPQYTTSHNSFIQPIATGGIPTFILFNLIWIYACIASIWMSVVSYRRKDGSFCLWSIYVAILISSTVGNLFESYIYFNAFIPFALPFYVAYRSIIMFEKYRKSRNLVNE